jgi:hypothetical protein
LTALSEVRADLAAAVGEILTDWNIYDVTPQATTTPAAVIRPAGNYVELIALGRQFQVELELELITGSGFNAADLELIESAFESLVSALPGQFRVQALDAPEPDLTGPNELRVPVRIQTTITI